MGVTTSVDEPMEESIRRADLVLAMISTGLLEAISIGRIARAVIISDAFDVYADSFVSDPFLGVIRTRAELHAVLSAYRGAISNADYRNQRTALVPYVAASGPAAAQFIAKAIVEAA
jgi:hypothetical protein